jgi:hypothetical protein
VDQVEVDVVEAEVIERAMAGGEHVLALVVRVPQLGRNPQLLALAHALGKEALERRADRLLVPIVAGAVEVAVARRDGVVDDLRGHVGRRLPHPEADHRHRGQLLALREHHERMGWADGFATQCPNVIRSIQLAYLRGEVAGPSGPAILTSHEAWRCVVPLLPSISARGFAEGVGVMQRLAGRYKSRRQTQKSALVRRWVRPDAGQAASAT